MLTIPCGGFANPGASVSRKVFQDAAAAARVCSAARGALLEFPDAQRGAEEPDVFCVPGTAGRGATCVGGVRTFHF